MFFTQSRRLRWWWRACRRINVRLPDGMPDGDATVQVFVGANASPATITVKGDQDRVREPHSDR